MVHTPVSAASHQFVPHDGKCQHWQNEGSTCSPTLSLHHCTIGHYQQMAAASLLIWNIEMWNKSTWSPAWIPQVLMPKWQNRTFVRAQKDSIFVFSDHPHLVNIWLKVPYGVFLFFSPKHPVCWCIFFPVKHLQSHVSYSSFQSFFPPDFVGTLLCCLPAVDQWNSAKLATGMCIAPLACSLGTIQTKPGLTCETAHSA